MFSGNVGSVCRLARNFSCTGVRLVNSSPLDWEVVNKFAVKAMHTADEITLHQSLAQAVADCTMVIGTTARTWGDRDRTMDLESFSLPHDPPQSADDTALVFGSEENGLTNDELALCHYLVTVPTSPEQPSMNLSHAVAVVSARFASLFSDINHDQGHFKTAKTRSRAKSGELEDLIQHLHCYLDDIRYLNPQNPEHIMKDIREVIFRAGLTSRQVRMVRGIISKSARMSGFTEKNKK